ncbi:MAG TPA: sigma-70 family RNA polymerase sigma factor [Streptosporangiaceae bacterium]|nr:sigma-70 family RNA polymerase sigma factor [Streptosporangiaceae bacterium]
MDYLVCAENGPRVADLRYAELADSELLSLAQAGDQRALEALCRRNWRLVYRSFARYTNDPFEAEDLTQEVFLRALRSLPKFADTGAPYTAYLLRIAANLARDRWRAGPARAVPTDQVPDRPVPGPGPDGMAVANDRRAVLISALDRLAPDQRAVLRLRILEGRSSAEVGALTNRSPAAVRQLQVRALAALRDALGDQAAGLTEDFGRD